MLVIRFFHGSSQSTPKPKAAGFTLCCSRTEVDNDGIICHQTFECSHSDKPISNKVVDLTHQCQHPSRKIGCSWHINLSNRKSLSGVDVTSVVDHKREDGIFPLLVSSFPGTIIHK